MNKPKILIDVLRENLDDKDAKDLHKKLKQVGIKWIFYKDSLERDYYFMSLDQKSLYPWMQDFFSISNEDLLKEKENDKNRIKEKD